MTRVNVSIEIDGKEERRIVRRHLAERFKLTAKWEGDEAVEYENYYHGSGQYRRVIGKVTPLMRKAKEVYDAIGDY